MKGWRVGSSSSTNIYYSYVDKDDGDCGMVDVNSPFHKPLQPVLMFEKPNVEKSNEYI